MSDIKQRLLNESFKGQEAMRREALTRIEALEAQLAAAREALMLFADPSAWRLGGSCDPNSGAFRGQEIAQHALAALGKATQ